MGWEILHTPPGLPEVHPKEVLNGVFVTVDGCWTAINGAEFMGYHMI